jgi:sugar lactone lactonase YvrE
MNASLLYRIPTILGEGPLWHPLRRSIFWVDIEGCAFYEMSLVSGAVTKRTTDFRISLMIPWQENRLLVALQGGIGAYDLVTQEWEWMIPIDQELPNNRCNDGACDARGRLWIGTMDLQFKPGAGSLYCVDESWTAHKKLGGLAISNGILWSLNGQFVYHIDSPTQTIKSYHFDAETGDLMFAKVLVEIPPALGTPDGMCMDEEGMLWVAHWGGFGVYRWDPASGKLLDKIELPAPQVSSCAFGGDSMNQLFITTARQEMGPDELDRYPESGCLFVAELKTRGRRLHSCRLPGVESGGNKNIKSESA